MVADWGASWRKSCKIREKQLLLKSDMEQFRSESRFFSVAAKNSYLLSHRQAIRDAGCLVGPFTEILL